MSSAATRSRPCDENRQK